MTKFKTIACAALAALTMTGSLVGTSTQAQARGGAVAAGIIGGAVLGAMAAHAYERPVYVVERRRPSRLVHVRSHRCGCVVHHHYVAR